MGHRNKDKNAKTKKTGKRVVRRKETVESSVQAKRKKAKHTGLNPKLFSKIKQQYFDYDYINELSEDEKAWLSKFTDEYLGANLSGSKPLHRTKALKKDCFDRNNSRNRDIYNIKAVNGALGYTDELPESYTPNPEDDIIELLDQGKEPSHDAEVLEGEEYTAAGSEESDGPTD